MPDLHLNDVTFLIDTREQTPWDFEIINSADIHIKQKRATLKTGDYSIEGYESPDMPFSIAVERKSLDDLLSCCGHSRERFEEQLARLSQFESKCVIIEAPLGLIESGFYRSKIKPQSVTGSIIGWSQKPGIPFFFMRNATEASRWAARFMFIAARRAMRIKNEFE